MSKVPAPSGARSGTATPPATPDPAPAAPAPAPNLTPQALPPSAPAGPPAQSSPLAAGIKPKKQEPKPPKFQHEVPIADPRLDSSAHAAYYALLPAITAYALESVTKKYPDLDKHMAARFLELALVIGAEVPWMVVSHEGGHYRTATGYGWNPEITVTSWASGYTSYNVPENAQPTPEQFTIAGASGVNQETINGIYMMRQWALNGGARVHEALSFMLAETNLALYAAASVVNGHEVGSSSDPANYVARIQESGHDVSGVKLMGMAMAADLLSAPFWATLIGGFRFLKDGDRVVAYPSFKIGDFKIALPSFHMLLTTEGPVLGGRTMIKGKGKVRLELSADSRYDGRGGDVGVGLFRIPTGLPKVEISPWVRTSIDHGDFGYAGGADVHWQLSKPVGVVAGLSYRHEDLLSQPYGKENGLSGHGGLTVRF